jgi:hypothetical protein
MTDETVQIERPDNGTKSSPSGLPKGIVEIAPGLTMTEPVEGLGVPRYFADGYYLRVSGFSTGGFTMDVAFGPDPVEREARIAANRGEWSATNHVHIVATRLERGSDEPYLLRHALTCEFANPWASEEFWNWHWLRWIEHMPRPSIRVPGNLAYYQSPAKRAAGIETPIKPGRYLRKYFGDILSEEEIQRLGIAWQSATTPPELHVTQDADEIEKVYRGVYNGSCMHFGDGGWDGDCHPARVYAGPDLGIAYIGDANAAAGRCLVWPEKKIYYPKFYGDHIRLEMALGMAGWKAGEDHDFDGARIRRIYDSDRGLYTVPYCDTHSVATDTGRYLILDDDGDVCLRETNGTNVSDPDSHYRVTCDDCGDRVDEHDIRHVEDEERAICVDCLRRNYTRCDLTYEYHRDENFVDAAPGWDISQEAVDRDLAFLCEGSDTYYPNAVGTVEMANGDTWSELWFNRHGGVCEFDGLNYPRDELEDIGHGIFVASDNVEAAHADSSWLARVGRDEHPDQLTFDDKLTPTAADFNLAPEPEGWDAVKAQFVATFGPDTWADRPEEAKEQALVLLHDYGVGHLIYCTESPRILPSLRLACMGLLAALGVAPVAEPLPLAA